MTVAEEPNVMDIPFIDRARPHDKTASLATVDKIVTHIQEARSFKLSITKSHRRFDEPYSMPQRGFLKT